MQQRGAVTEHNSSGCTEQDSTTHPSLTLEHTLAHTHYTCIPWNALSLAPHLLCRTQPFSHALTPPRLSLSLSDSLLLSIPHSLTHSHTHSSSGTPWHLPGVDFTRSLSHSPTFTLSLSHSLTDSLPNPTTPLSPFLST
jgi:hypothetical protein